MSLFLKSSSSVHRSNVSRLLNVANNPRCCDFHWENGVRRVKVSAVNTIANSRGLKKNKCVRPYSML